jgi:hypothetical protein
MDPEVLCIFVIDKMFYVEVPKQIKVFEEFLVLIIRGNFFKI